MDSAGESVSRPRVVYWTHQPTPYTVDRWNAVAQRGTIDLVAWFDVEREFDRSWTFDEQEWSFEWAYLSRRRLFGHDFSLPDRQVIRDRPDLLVQEYGYGSAVLGFFINRASVRRLAFRFLPTHATWFPRTRFKEFMKRWMFWSADSIKTAGTDGIRALERYGFPHDRRFAVTQAIDVEHFAKARQLSPSAREARREAMGLAGCVFLYVGRLWERKGLGTLLDAYATLATEGLDASLLLVGDGVDESTYRERAKALPNVVFAGYVQKDQMPDYYALADVFVFPTLGDPHGLVVDEAMAAGLPVISTSAAGDIYERVPDGEAGYIVDPANPEVLADRMRLCVIDPEQRARLAQTAVLQAVKRGPDRYAEDFERFVFATLDMRPRRNIPVLLSWVLGRLLRALISFGVKELPATRSLPPAREE